MATIQEYIQAKLIRYRIALSDVEISALIIDQGLNPIDEYTLENSTSAKTVIVRVVPELLLRPDITEGGYSEKWDRDGILAYYSLLCKEIGLVDELNAVPTLKNVSYLW